MVGHRNAWIHDCVEVWSREKQTCPIPFSLLGRTTAVAGGYHSCDADEKTSRGLFGRALYTPFNCIDLIWKWYWSMTRPIRYAAASAESVFRFALLRVAILL